jgi:hypothetical protein
MLDKTVGDTDLAFIGHPDEIDPAPGGIHFIAHLEIGGAGGEAEATMDALEIFFLLGGIGGVERARTSYRVGRCG